MNMWLLYLSKMAGNGKTCTQAHHGVILVPHFFRVPLRDEYADCSATEPVYADSTLSLCIPRFAVGEIDAARATST